VLRRDGTDAPEVAAHNRKFMERLAEAHVRPFGYTLVATDEFKPKRDLFDEETVLAILDTDLVIVDLTGMPSAILYILARLHGSSRPCIVVSASTDGPGEIAQQRILKVDLDNPGSVAEIGREIVERLLWIDTRMGIRVPPSANGSARVSGSGNDHPRFFPPRFSDDYARWKICGDKPWRKWHE
jgi:hypothetical protein